MEPEGGRRIVVHLGAHKTATTYLQSRLHGSTAYLRAHGVRFVPVMRLRREVTGRIAGLLAAAQAGGDGAGPAADAVRRLLAGPERHLLLSDENLIGTCAGIMATGRLYPRIGPRLRVLDELLPERPCYVLTVRNYPDFFASAYCEALRTVPFFGFRDFLARRPAADRGWAQVVETLVRIAGHDRVRLFRFETLGTRPDALFSALCGFAVDLARLAPSDDTRPGFSARAVEVLSGIAALAGGDIAAQVVAPVAARFPRSADAPGFDPWEPEERRRLLDAYHRHLEEIRAAHGDLFL